MFEQSASQFLRSTGTLLRVAITVCLTILLHGDTTAADPVATTQIDEAPLELAWTFDTGG